MELFKKLQNSISKHENRNAFFINNVFYTYLEFAKVISKIRKAIENNINKEDKNIGLVMNDDLETYASIIALWFEGKAYVPLNPEQPKDRNESVIKQAGIKTIIDSSESTIFSKYSLIESKNLSATSMNLLPKSIDNNELVYILFTSGTTGSPKGVPITRQNISGFIDAFWDLGLDIDENDRVLQMFDLTFDLSVVSYLVPLLKGACVYTIPKDKIRYSYIYKLLDEEKLTVTLMVPSILHYLRQYFEEFDFPDLRYSLFCGEALPLDVTKEWAQCIPNAKIFNVYGPTEHTVYCTCSPFNIKGKNKSHNGILAIGKVMKGTKTIIIDDNNQVLPFGKEGQLCLAGVQLTTNYWKNDKKNKEAFFFTDYEGKQERFYKTGDLCRCDEEGDLIYLGRVDFQTQIQGFRVELTEIEFHAKSFLEKINVTAISFPDAIGNTEIGLVLESEEFETTQLYAYMKSKMPVYMIPRQIKFMDAFPLNVNGKTDRNKMKLLFVNS